MPPKGKKEAVREISSTDEFRALVSNPKDKRLHIVDLFAGWAGPCLQMVPTFKGLQLSIDFFDDRVSIVQVKQDLGIPVVCDIKGEDAGEKQSSKPKFLFFKGGKLLREIDGCNAPEILATINKLIPNVDDEE